MIHRLAKNRLLLSMTIALAVAIALSALFAAGFLETYGVGITDSLYGGKEPLPSIAIIAIDDRSLQEIGRWPWDRSVHAQMIDKIGRYAAVVAFDISFFETSPDDPSLESAINAAGNMVLVSEYTAFSEKDGKIYGEELLEPVFSSRNVGFANIFTDSDGVVRSLPAHIEGVKGQDPLDVAVIEAAIGGFIEISSEKVLINYAGPPGTFRYYSYSDVINDIVDPAVFDGKIVLTGATAPDLRDTHLTPVSNAEMPGVEIHANAIQTILTEDFLDYQGAYSVVLMIFILSLLAGVFLYKFRTSVATGFVFALALVFVISSVLAFDSGTVINILYGLLTISVSYVAHVAVFYVTESRQRRVVTSIFGKYVSKEVANEILKKTSGEELSLKGEKRNISILFSDIRGFTSLSEKMTPEQLVEFLNKYLSAMTEVIMQRRGVVDKYIGDAIMAFWGAPLEHEQHEKEACLSALGMKAKLEELKIPNLSIGIGINTGHAVVGNMGSAQRVNYTAIGDAVNAASRLEGLNKEYHTAIIIGESTYQKVKDEFVCRELDYIKVKGKDIPIKIYELAGKKGDVDQKTLKAIEHFHSGLVHYRKKKWAVAAKEFSAAVKIRNDYPSHIFIERCKVMKKHPPARWDGVFTWKTK